MPNPYCQKRRATWYVRLRIPNDLTGILGTQFVRSLGTGRSDEARALAASAAGAAPRIWDMLRVEAMAKVLGKPVSELTVDDVRKANWPRISADYDLLDEAGREALRKRMGEIFREATTARNDTRREVESARTFLELFRHGKEVGYERALTLMGTAAAPRAEAPVPSPALPADAAPAKPAARHKRARQTLTELSDEFFASESQGEKSRISYLAALKTFERVVGPKAISNVTEDDLVKFREELLKQRGRDGRDKAARATVQKNLGHVKAMLRWAAMPGRRYLPTDPGRDVHLPKKPKGATEDGMRLAFDEAQLGTIFSSPLYVGHMNHMRWSEPGPYIVREDRHFFFLAMYLTGARNEELPGATLYDLAGIECLDLRKTGKKTPAGPRLVPILPELRATGFADWANARIAAGGKLFRGPEAVARWGVFPSQYLRAIGVGDRLHSAYSLRHSHRQMLRGSGLSDELADKTFGHEGPRTGRKYGKGIVTRQEAETWLATVRCPVDMSHLGVR